MNAKQLKDAILQYAMQGQLFNDLREDATILYGDIKNFQEEQIEAKLLKKDKDDYSIDLNQVPFDIPENWKWVKIGDVFSVKGGKRVPRGYKLLTSETPYVYLRVADMKDGSITSNDLHYVDEEIYQGIKNYTISSDNLYLTIAGTIGKVGTIPQEFDGALLTENAVKIVINHVDKQFIKLLFESPIVQNQFQQAVNKVAQPKLSIRNINQVMIPLPPLSVQIELVHRIEELESKLKVYNELTTNLDLLNKSFPLNLEKSILQYAMQGKLVEQNSNDEPAKYLIESIQLEKEHLIKEKIIKKEKTLPPITEGEIPFAIPNSWEWVRLGDLATVTSGSTPLKSNSEYYLDGTIAWITSGETRNTVITFAENFITEKALKECSLTLHPKGTLIMAMYGQGKTRGQVSELGIEAATNQACAAIALYLQERILNEYVKICLRSVYNSIREQAAGGAQPNLNLSKIKNILIPLPPLMEQKRILETVKKLLNITMKLVK